MLSNIDRLSGIREILIDGEVKYYQLNSYLVDILQILAHIDSSLYEHKIQRLIDIIKILLSGDYHIFESNNYISELVGLLETICLYCSDNNNGGDNFWLDDDQSNGRCVYNHDGFTCEELLDDEDRWCSVCKK